MNQYVSAMSVVNSMQPSHRETSDFGRKDFLNENQSDQMGVERDNLLSQLRNLASNPSASTYNGTAESHVS